MAPIRLYAIYAISTSKKNGKKNNAIQEKSV